MVNSELIFAPRLRHEAWRYYTYQFLHAGFPHIFGNVLMQLFLGNKNLLRLEGMIYNFFTRDSVGNGSWKSASWRGLYDGRRDGLPLGFDRRHSLNATRLQWRRLLPHLRLRRQHNYQLRSHARIGHCPPNAASLPLHWL